MKTIIIVAIIISITILFIIGLISFQNKKPRDAKLNKIFKKVVREYNLFIHYKDVFSRRLIGFDKKNKKLLLLNLNKNDKLKACVDIDEINSSSIVHVKDEHSKSARKIFLELIRDNDKQPIKFCFYDESDGIENKTGLLLKARHWRQRINFHKNYGEVNPAEYVL